MIHEPRRPGRIDDMQRFAAVTGSSTVLWPIYAGNREQHALGRWPKYGTWNSALFSQKKQEKKMSAKTPCPPARLQLNGDAPGSHA